MTSLIMLLCGASVFFVSAGRDVLAIVFMILAVFMYGVRQIVKAIEKVGR